MSRLGTVVVWIVAEIEIYKASIRAALAQLSRFARFARSCPWTGRAADNDPAPVQSDCYCMEKCESISCPPFDPMPHTWRLGCVVYSETKKKNKMHFPHNGVAMMGEVARAK